MLKVLLRKELSAIAAMYFKIGKKGQQRSKGGTIGMIILWCFLIPLIAFAFFGMGMMFCDTLVAIGADWLYFVLMGMIAFLMALIGSVFTTYSTLFKAKDNDLLLSMPIKPRNIIISRMLTVVITSTVYHEIVWIPAMLVYWIMKPATVLTVICPILVSLIGALLVSVFSCILGWLVALGTRKMHNKTVGTVLLSLLLIGVYYVCYFKMNELLQSILLHSEKIGALVQTYIFPLYSAGMGASGNILYLLGFFAFTAVLFILCVFVLSKTFTKIVITNVGTKEKTYVAQKTKALSAYRAVLKKEFKHWLQSPAYLMNTGLGLLIFIVVGVAAVLNKGTLQQFTALLPVISEKLSKMFPAFLCCGICLLVSTNVISAPSISLEGKSFWILKTLPIDTRDVLRAKQMLHVLLNLLTIPPTICIGIAFSFNLSDILYMAVCAFLFSYLSANVGLLMNLRKYNLDWTNETIPIKQSSSVVITMFGGWGVAILLALGAFFTSSLLSADQYLMMMSLVLMVGAIWTQRILFSKGIKMYDEIEA